MRLFAVLAAALAAGCGAAPALEWEKTITGVDQAISIEFDCRNDAADLSAPLSVAAGRFAVVVSYDGEVNDSTIAERGGPPTNRGMRNGVVRELSADGGDVSSSFVRAVPFAVSSEANGVSVIVGSLDSKWSIQAGGASWYPDGIHSAGSLVRLIGGRLAARIPQATAYAVRDGSRAWLVSNSPDSTVDELHWDARGLGDVSVPLPPAQGVASNGAPVRFQPAAAAGGIAIGRGVIWVSTFAICSAPYADCGNVGGTSVNGRIAGWHTLSAFERNGLTSVFAVAMQDAIGSSVAPLSVSLNEDALYRAYPHVVRDEAGLDTTVLEAEKRAPNGDVIWQKRLGRLAFTGNDDYCDLRGEIRTLSAYDDGGFLLTGVITPDPRSPLVLDGHDLHRTTCSDAACMEGFVASFDKDGTLEWYRPFDPRTSGAHTRALGAVPGASGHVVTMWEERVTTKAKPGANYWMTPGVEPDTWTCCDPNTDMDAVTTRVRQWDPHEEGVTWFR